jgi:hypothetical protein
VGVQLLAGAVMQRTIAMAENLCRGTAKLAEVVIRSRNESELIRTAEKMFKFLVEMGRTKPWPL